MPEPSVRVGVVTTPRSSSNIGASSRPHRVKHRSIVPSSLDEHSDQDDNNRIVDTPSCESLYYNLSSEEDNDESSSLLSSVEYPADIEVSPDALRIWNEGKSKLINGHHLRLSMIEDLAGSSLQKAIRPFGYDVIKSFDASEEANIFIQPKGGKAIAVQLKTTLVFHDFEFVHKSLLVTREQVVAKYRGVSTLGIALKCPSREEIDYWFASRNSSNVVPYGRFVAVFYLDGSHGSMGSRYDISGPPETCMMVFVDKVLQTTDLDTIGGKQALASFKEFVVSEHNKNGKEFDDFIGIVTDSVVFPWRNKFEAYQTGSFKMQCVG